MEVKDFGQNELPQQSVSIKENGDITSRKLKVNSTPTRVLHTMLFKQGTGPG